MELFKLLAGLMATPNLPADEDTRADFESYEAINTNNDTIEATADQDYLAGQIILWGPYVCRVNHNVASGDTMSLRVKDGILVVTSRVGAGSTFATPSQEVWYDPITRLCHDVEGSGMVGIGPLALAMDANGAIAFYKRRYWIEGELT